MFEHVGVGHYKEFFAKVRGLLTDDGIAVLHSINRSDGPGATSAWVKKYIFPGGYIPALSEVLPHIERAKLYVTDIEILRLHYAKTIREWAVRFAANRERAKEIYDERFCRMWEFYLAASEMRLPLCRHEQLPDPVHARPARPAVDPQLHDRGRRTPAHHRLAAAPAEIGSGGIGSIGLLVACEIQACG